MAAGRRPPSPPTTTPQGGHVLYLGLRLLDHQIVGDQGEMLGNVDDLELREDAQGLLVTGLLSGPAGLAGRLPGLLGAALGSMWRTLHPQQDPRPLVLPMAHVRAIRSAVEVSAWAEEVLATQMRLELWLRRRVIGRLPGATGGEHRFGGDLAATARPHPELALAAGAHRLSRLIGAEVVDGAGAGVGAVLDVGAEPVERTGLEVGRLRVCRIVYGPRRLGAQLGYTVDARQGPWPVAVLMRRWHSSDRCVELADVAAVDWEQRVVTLSGAATPRHPHAT